MTYQDYKNELERAARAKKIFKACTAAAALVAVLSGLGYVAGYNRGHAAGLFQGTDAATRCIEEGANGWEVSATGVRCIYE